MSRSIQYNNAGVACTEAGYHKVAWELFKGALEVRLAMERSETTLNDDAFVLAVQKDNTYIQKAEFHLCHITDYIKTIPHNSNSSIIPVCDAHIDGVVQNSSATSSAHSRSSGSTGRQLLAYKTDLMEEDCYSPFLFRRPMRLAPDVPVPTRKESATVIFNLALVDHLKNRCSEQAVQLYELAMTLLTGDVVDALGIALMNNIGVWCYENGDIDGTMTCMAHLSNFLCSCNEFIDEAQREGLQANILWLTNPPSSASPAA